MMPKVPSTLQSSLGRNVVQNHTKSRNSKVLLTKQYFYVHNSLNTPTKPMMFPNIMLKLSGLFFACRFFLYIAIPPQPVINDCFSVKAQYERTSV
jgi:hypothetical protein